MLYKTSQLTKRRTAWGVCMKDFGDSVGKILGMGNFTGFSAGIGWVLELKSIFTATLVLFFSGCTSEAPADE